MEERRNGIQRKRERRKGEKRERMETEKNTEKKMKKDKETQRESVLVFLILKTTVLVCTCLRGLCRSEYWLEAIRLSHPRKDILNQIG